MSNIIYEEDAEMSEKLNREELKDVAGGAGQPECKELSDECKQTSPLLDGDEQGSGLNASANDVPGQRRSFR